MGYTTEFIGKFVFDRQPSKELVEYINLFSKTRHVKRDTEKLKKLFPDWEERCWKGQLGEDGEFFLQRYDEMYDHKQPAHDTDAYLKRNGISDDNNPPASQPGLWCQWFINADGDLVWDGGEKFYDYVEWLEYLISNFFKPEGMVLSGKCMYIGERRDDWGYISVENNTVTRIPNDIQLEDQEDIISVRMPEVLKEELETVIGLQCGISIETAMRRYLMWCIREPEKFKAWYRHADIVNTDYEKRTGFYKKMLEWLDYAYGDSAFEAGIYTGMEEFCKRYDVEDKLVQEAERLLKR